MLDWSNPTPEMLSAARMMHRCAERGGMNETLFVEWVVSAKESLWYLQAADWAEHPPEDLLIDDGAREMFKKGMSLIVQIVDLGYDTEKNMWWPLVKVWPEANDAQMGTLTLMDTATMLERMVQIPIWPKDVPRAYAQPGFLTASAGFWVFFSLICGPQWRRRFASFMQAAQEARRIRIDVRPKRRRRV